MILLVPTLAYAGDPRIAELAAQGEEVAKRQAEKIDAQDWFIVQQAAVHAAKEKKWSDSDKAKDETIAKLESQKGQAPAYIGLTCSGLIIAGGVVCLILGMHVTGYKVIAGGILGASLSYAGLYYGPQIALIGLGVAALAVIGMAAIIVIDLRKSKDSNEEWANAFAQAKNIGGLTAEGERVVKQALGSLASKYLQRETS